VAQLTLGIVTPTVSRPRAGEPAGVLAARGDGAEAQAPLDGDRCRTICGRAVAELPVVIGAPAIGRTGAGELAGVSATRDELLPEAERYVLKQPLHVPLPWLEDVTTTSVAPGLVAAGVVPVIWVGLTTVRPPSSLPPMVTLVTSTKLVPVIVTPVPPPNRSVAGLTAVTVIGAAGPTSSLQPATRSPPSRLLTIAVALARFVCGLIERFPTPARC